MLIVGYHRCWRIQGHVSGYFCWTFWWFLWVMQLITFIFAPRGRQDHVKLDNKSVEYTLPFTNKSQFFLQCFWLNSPEPNRKGRENKKSCLLNLFNWVKNILFTDQLRITLKLAKSQPPQHHHHNVLKKANLRELKQVDVILSRYSYLFSREIKYRTETADISSFWPKMAKK